MRDNNNNNNNNLYAYAGTRRSRNMPASHAPTHERLRTHALKHTYALDTRTGDNMGAIHSRPYCTIPQSSQVNVHETGRQYGGWGNMRMDGVHARGGGGRWEREGARRLVTSLTRVYPQKLPPRTILRSSIPAKGGACMPSSGAIGAMPPRTCSANL